MLKLQYKVLSTYSQIEHNIPFFGLRFTGERFDCGTKTGFVAANLAYALERKDLGEDIKNYLQERICLKQNFK